MSALEILKYPDPRLKEKANPVTNFDAELHTLLESMKETMYAADGIGLAATQVGVMKRVIVLDTSPDGTKYLELINPVLVKTEGTAQSKEGCLSIPEFRETISRKAHVTVKALDRNGNEFQFDAEELLAFCVQHEIDHLDGILFVDHLTPLKKQLFLRWVKKQATLDQEEQ